VGAGFEHFCVVEDAVVDVHAVFTVWRFFSGEDGHAGEVVGGGDGALFP